MFPANPFHTLADIREYLAGERIQCLICSKKYLRLTYRHLALHDLTADGYRERFGIPWTYSLTSATSRWNSGRKQKAVNLANLTRRRAGDFSSPPRKTTLAAERHWREIVRPQGPRHNAQVHEIIPCDDCGVDVPTTKLTAVHGTRCKLCRVIAKEYRDQLKAALLLPRCA